MEDAPEEAGAWGLPGWARLEGTGEGTVRGLGAKLGVRI